MKKPANLWEYKVNAIIVNFVCTRVFHKCTEMPILAFSSLLHENKKIQWQNVTPSGNRTQAASDYKSNMLLSTHNLAFACKTDTLGSLYSHALLILLKSI